ncbi:MAG: hypothetical protein R2784_01455 [Saprospiraceae bacterium]
MKRKSRLWKSWLLVQSSSPGFRIDGQIPRYDYNDMILWTIKRHSKKRMAPAFTTGAIYMYLLMNFRINGAQNEILQLLISYWESPNLFIVGDDDQSICKDFGGKT